MKLIFITLCITLRLGACSICFEDWVDQEIEVTEAEIDDMIESSGEESFPYFFYLHGRSQAFEDMKDKLKEDCIYEDS
jgi:hypothetical protein